MQTIKQMILKKLNNATDLVKSAKQSERFDLIAPHKDYPNVESYIINLVDSIDKELNKEGHKVSKSVLLKIIQSYAGEEGANEKRAEEIIKVIH